MNRAEIMKDFNRMEETLEQLEAFMEKYHGGDFGQKFWNEWGRFREKYTGHDCDPGEEDVK